MPIVVTSEICSTITRLCNTKEGRNAAELSEILGVKRASLCWYIAELLKTKRIFRGGLPKKPRYFPSEEVAEAYTNSEKEGRTLQNQLSAQKRRENAAEYGKKKIEQKKAEKKISLERRDSGLIIATREQEKEHKKLHSQANVIWPENVKVTIIPTSQDMRFVAVVEPGKGQISRDWAASRKLSART